MKMDSTDSRNTVTGGACFLASLAHFMLGRSVAFPLCVIH